MIISVRRRTTVLACASVLGTAATGTAATAPVAARGPEPSAAAAQANARSNASPARGRAVAASDALPAASDVPAERTAALGAAARFAGPGALAAQRATALDAFAVRGTARLAVSGALAAERTAVSGVPAARVAVSDGFGAAARFVGPGAVAARRVAALDAFAARRGRRPGDVGGIAVRLAQAVGELDRLDACAEAAVERYNAARVALGRARADADDTARRAGTAQRTLETARADLAALAAAAYREATGFGPYAALTGSGGPQGYLDRAELAEVVARHRAAAVDRVRATAIVADVFRRRSAAALAERAAAANRAAAAEQAARGEEAAQRATVRTLKARVRDLRRRLGHRPGKQELRAAPRGRGRGAEVVRAALRWLGTPYSWGGGTTAGPSRGIEQGARTKGFDCSGLAMYAWARAGVRLDHWTGTQWTSGPHVPLNELRRGDLVFFADDTGDPATIHHVGIYVGGGRMVEAPYTGARVRVSSVHRAGLIGATRPAG
ncbi:NlpC/P60 family protein [Actinomadura atramentaria]|uniref:NlpC/P60 family protein n=1 Tax=Actinomadura atramentaria TaxID=1990 RepID=UPI000A0479EF|nr:NlpC/P60 family protein [Actinomadura atramentaria]